MGRLVAGDLVRGDFPFSEGEGFKARPCVVLASWQSGASTDVLVCMASTRAARDPHAIPFDEDDLVWGSLPQPGIVRPAYLFAAREDFFERKGQLRPEKMEEIRRKVREIVG